MVILTLSLSITDSIALVKTEISEQLLNRLL